jgi:hypothetical protein
MRFQQVAKELHVELVVLHDQDGFCHPVPPLIFRKQVRPFSTSLPPPPLAEK